MMALAFVMRLDGISSPPFDNAVARQFHSAILARAYYVDQSKLSTQRRLVVDAWRDEVKPIEPPVMEVLAATGYRVVGYEALWLPRALSVFWWIAGAMLLYGVARRFRFVAPAALASCAVYLYVPFGVLESRAFQPDPLLIAAILASILTVLRYDEEPSNRRLAFAAIALALAFFFKPGVAAPLLLPLLLAIAVRRPKTDRRAAGRALCAFALATVPMLAWYAYGTLVTSYLRGHFSAKVSPSLILQSSFWSGWWDQVVFVLTYPPKAAPLALLLLVAGATGVLLAKTFRTKTLLAALWAGYVLYGLVFTIHISTHNYYSLPLIPILALSLGSLVDAILRRVSLEEPWTLAAVAVAAVLTAGAVSWKLHPAFTDHSFGQQAARYAEAGAAADHTARALYVDTHYGEPTRYYGWTAGTVLMSGYEKQPGELAQRLLSAALASNSTPSCLIFTGAGLRTQLEAFESNVATRFATVRKSEDFAVYDLTKPAGSQADGC